ncbi:hypothetical protein NZK35_09270 [Stieleria sp. ICT_E10.1]|uniref:hypothetical protein n=1 Tax=Stieleria sedimenti TaxID=2976331 RepID=UPI002180731B|nr:hypothetical protein [Stieleria sedimenti]MCS7466832.1 hypothetical protein [Stieleria sedimenti]
MMKRTLKTMLVLFALMTPFSTAFANPPDGLDVATDASALVPPSTGLGLPPVEPLPIQAIPVPETMAPSEPSQNFVHPDPKVIPESFRAAVPLVNEAANSVGWPVHSPMGTAILHLSVPSGSYVTINDNPTRNRNWSSHRHYVLSGIPYQGSREVRVKVGLRKDRCPCKFNNAAACQDCGTDYVTCCKTVRLSAGEEEYLTFDFKSDSADNDHRAKLSFEIIDETSFRMHVPGTAGQPLGQAVGAPSLGHAL